MRVNAVAVLLSTLAVVVLLSNSTDLFYPFSSVFFEVVGTCVAVFIFGYVFTRFLLPPAWTNSAARLFEKPSHLVKGRHAIFVSLFFLFSALGALDRFLMFGPGFFLPETVMQYRILLTQEGGQTVIKGLSLGNFFIFLVPTYLVAYGERFSAKAKLLIIFVFLFDIYLSSARSSLFLSALIAFYYWAVARTLTLSFLVKVGFLLSMLILGFNLIGEIVGKSSDELGILVYAAAPLHAFDELLQAPGTLEDYFLSFFPLQGVLGRVFGFAASNELPNVLTPLPTNVYSMYGVFFNDFGLIGLFWFVFMAGIFSGFVESIFRVTGSPVFRVYVALNLSILSLSVFYDYYTTSGVVWITFLLTPLFFFSRARTPGRLRCSTVMARRI